MSLKACFDYWTDANAPQPNEEFFHFDFLPLFEPVEEVVWSDDEENDADNDYGRDDSILQRKSKSALNPDKVMEVFTQVGNGQDRISPDQAVIMAYRLNLAPSQQTIAEMKKNYPSLGLDEAKAWLKTIDHSEDVPQNFERVFRKFDKGDGRISKKQLTTLFSERGDRLSADDINRLLRVLNSDQAAYVAHREFVKKLLAKAA